MEYKRTVRYYETDKMGITHHANYILWMEESRLDFLEKLGWPYSRLEEQGLASPVTKLSCKYVRPTTFPDEVTVRTFVKDFDGIRLTFGYEMKKADDTVVFIGESTHCFLNKDGRPIRADRACPQLCEELLRHKRE